MVPQFVIALVLAQSIVSTTKGVLGQRMINIKPYPTATVTENNSLQLTCTYSRDGTCPSNIVIEWWLNGAEKLSIGWTGTNCVFLRGSQLERTCGGAPDRCIFQLTLRHVRNSQHGDNWKCIAQSTVSAGTSVYVEVPITGVQLTSPTISNISMLENVPYNFSCLTTAGRPDSTVQWYMYRGQTSGNEIELTGAVSAVEPVGTLSVTRSTLSYTAANRDAGYQIYCKAYNIGLSKSIRSRTIVSNIMYPPVIKTLQNRTIIASSALTVQCTTTPGNPAQTSFRWTRSTDSWSQVGQILSLPSVTKGDAAEYTCTARNVMTPTAGSPVDGSDSVTFTVNVLYPPVIKPIQDRAIIASLALTVQCTTTPGNPSQTSFRWTRSTDSWSQVGQTLSLPSVTKGDAAEYTCTARNVMTPTAGSPVDGSDSETFSVDVLYPPVIKPLSNRTIIASSALTVQCTTTPGNPAQTSYRWTRSRDNWSQVGQTLSLTSVTKGDAAEYTCTALNVIKLTTGSPVDGSDSDTFTVNVLYPPVIKPIQDRAIIVSSALTVQCTTTPGNPTQTSFRWTRSTDNWSQVGQTLSLPSVMKGDAAEYTCTAWNVMTPTTGSPVDGSDSETFTVNVLYPPVIKPLQNRTIKAYSALTVQCTTTPGTPTQTSFRWTRSTDNWSQDSQILSLANVTKSYAAEYTCTAWNVMTPTAGPPMHGTDTQTFTVNIMSLAGSRLVGENGSKAGFLELRVGGPWMRACADNIGVNEATVICRAQGYYKYPLRNNRIRYIKSTQTTTSYPPTVQCLGSEFDINWCRFSSTNHTCTMGEVFIDCAPPVEDIVHLQCTTSSWLVKVDIAKMLFRFPDFLTSDLYLGDNSCTGIPQGNNLVIVQDFTSCFSVQKQLQGGVGHYNQLVYAPTDPAHPSDVKAVKWRLELECNNLNYSGIMIPLNHSVTFNNIISSSKFEFQLEYYQDSNYMQPLSSYSLTRPDGTTVYVKAYVTDTDWSIKMSLNTCFTSALHGGEIQDYFLIKDCCEADKNTHVISETMHETRFSFQMFERTTGHDEVFVHCHPVYCDTSRYDSMQQCNNLCGPVNI